MKTGSGGGAGGYISGTIQSAPWYPHSISIGGVTKIQVLQQEVNRVQVLLSLVSQQRVAADKGLNKVVLDYASGSGGGKKRRSHGVCISGQEIKVDEAAVAAAEAAAVVLATLVQVSLAGNGTTCTGDDHL